ncbi:tRNA (adenosine(37)-N6)-threonylcarbamoyltransferase complex transferase subunit TsaD [bacterium]|nr:MAG: tRNA (adenosine(37)-N6)-threonylcarbamoyltransferase complex transferase subunit TsaD [bacterium]
MYVLGIETSCDETSAAVVKDGRVVMSLVTNSSLALHKKYGGIIPEIAFRRQLETIVEVTDRALNKSGVALNHINLLSVTNGPGFLGSLLVGITFVKALSLSLRIPLLGVDHLHGHIYANFLNSPGLRLPFVSLVVSGGHTSLFLVREFGRIDILGTTQDDACGEAFDKVAKILGLGYPGGPLIERLAKGGDPAKIKFGCSQTKDPLNFSFSGIKTAVLYLTRNRKLGLKEKSDIAASFQEAIIDRLVDKSLSACKLKKSNVLVLGGGVAANSRLREKFKTRFAEKGMKVYFPAREFCLDNAAMIAGLGFRLYKEGFRADLKLGANLN